MEKKRGWNTFDFVWSSVYQGAGTATNHNRNLSTINPLQLCCIFFVCIFFPAVETHGWNAHCQEDPRLRLVKALNIQSNNLKGPLRNAMYITPGSNSKKQVLKCVINVSGCFILSWEDIMKSEENVKQYKGGAPPLPPTPAPPPAPLLCSYVFLWCSYISIGKCQTSRQNNKQLCMFRFCDLSFGLCMYRAL